jgi:alpha-D-ribose 1-methylphosphonate 5-triphosphate synthase subunit PhnG
VVKLEADHSPEIVKEPAVCLTMVRAEDSIEAQPFYLGEAVTTECEVSVGGRIGYGVCLGEQPERAYCLAVADAVIAASGGIPESIGSFLETTFVRLKEAEQAEFSQIMRTQVDFKLFDEE